jgi:hypothetical protein
MNNRLDRFLQESMKEKLTGNADAAVAKQITKSLEAVLWSRSLGKSEPLFIR